MRTPFFGLVLLLTIAFGAEAYAQKRDLRTFDGDTFSSASGSDLQSARRKAAGIRDVETFGKAKEPPPKPFPWAALALGAVVVCALIPVGMKVVDSTRKDLEDQSTFGLQKGRSSEGSSSASKRPAANDLASLSPRPASRRSAAKSKPAQPAATPDDGLTPRDRVWDAVTASGSWISAEAVASSAGMTIEEADDELGALVDEGYLQTRRDSAGRQVFRPVS